MDSGPPSLSVAEAIQAGLHHHQAGRLAEAEVCYRRVHEADPANPDALHLLGVLAGQRGNREAAVELIGKAVALQPGSPFFQLNFGNALKDIGRRAEAEASYRRALALDPGYAEGHANLGLLLVDAGRLQEAECSLRDAIGLKPDLADVHNNLGNTLYALGRNQEAETCFRDALALNPEFAEAHSNLGQALRAQGRQVEAETCFRRTLALRPGLAEAHNFLANVLRNQGRTEEAETHYRAALAIDPGLADTHSNLLFLLNYLPGRTPQQIFDEHREFGRRFSPATPPRHHDNLRDPGRRLRIGYVSGDLREHPVAFFIEPVLASHDRVRYEIFCYYNFPRADAVTRRLRSLADQWREVSALDDESLARTIRQDAIDVLVDLSGHTGHNRLLVFARKPAPIQATWLGYLNTTGLEAMDYRMTDSHACPAGPLDALHSEKLVRFPDTPQWCYRPPSDCPQVSAPPRSTTGHVTFACFANPAKISSTIIELWTHVLARVRDSRLLIAGATLASMPREFLERFVRLGIDTERMQFSGAKPFAEYLEMHCSADIMLDTFPYSGGTTTCHALWMGVPVVTLAGVTATSCGGATLLHALDLDSLIARTPAEYVEIAASLATDREALAALRAGMRSRMTNSALMDEVRFTRNLEQAYRAMWRDWCGRAQ